MQRDQVRIIRHHENPITQHGHAAIGSFGRIPGHLFRPLPLVVPNRPSRLRIQREYLVRPGYEHHSIHDDRRHLQDEMIDGENPLHGEVLHVRSVDLVERTVPVAADVAVVGWPVAWFRMRNLFERQPPRRINRCDLGASRHPGERTQISQQITALIGAAARPRHQRIRLLG